MINEKLISSRSYYGAEKRKEKASKSSGAGQEDVYTSTWKFINELNFLNDNLVPRKSFSNISADGNPSSPGDMTSTSKSGNFSQSQSNVLKKAGKLMELVSQ